jgi:glycine oxidase
MVVGGGIAGSVMALTLLQKGYSVQLIDEPSLSSCSRIAAGIYSTFNFRRVAPVKYIDRYLSVSIPFYREAEKMLNASFLRERTGWKIISSESEKAQWEKAPINRFTNGKVEQNPHPQLLNTPFGIGHIQETGNLVISALIDAVKTKLIALNAYEQTVFDYDKLVVNAEGVLYDNQFSSRQLIFCEGHKLRFNPFFAFLKLRVVKGQLAHISVPQFTTDAVINRGVYFMNDESGGFFVGATYENGIDDEAISEEGKRELLDRVDSFLSVPYSVISQKAGVRLSTYDRHPVVGKHPQYSRLSLLNGLGSKGVLYAPLLAKQLLDELTNGIPVPREVSVARF